jgi:4-hydroxy-tetrahydrodipicolinate synthase
MPNARDAKEWAASGGLRGIGDSLYTPFSGPDGDSIDEDAYRALVRYCVGDLGHSMLWLTSGIAEWWSLTMDERKRLVELAIEEAHAIAPDTVIQACTSATAAKDCVELTQHAQEAGADICYLQTPPMEVHGGEGVLRFFQYVADRTDIALGMFNSPSSGYVLAPEESAAIANAIPAVCATKEGTMEHWRSGALHALAPEVVIWECDFLVYRAGWLQEGIVGPAQLGTAGYLHEIPERKILTEYWNLLWEGRIPEAIAYSRESQLDTIIYGVARWYCTHPGRPDYFTHWGEAYRCSAATLGLPMGDYPHSRPPQAILPDEAKAEIRALYEGVGFAKELART